MMIQQFPHKHNLLHVMMLSCVLSVIGFTGAVVNRKRRRGLGVCHVDIDRRVCGRCNGM